MKEDYEHDAYYARLHLPPAFAVLKEQAGFLVEYEEAPPDIDLKEVGDIVLKSSMGHIGFRVRRPDVDFRDLTIRSKRDSGAKTELAKILEGHCRWYLYCWADVPLSGGRRRFKSWILVDVHQLRKSGLLEKYRRDIPNKDKNGKPDGTYFRAYTVKELNYHSCLVASSNDLLDHPQDDLSLYQAASRLTLVEQIHLEAHLHDLAYRDYQD